jgi:hypothetical protein
MGSAFKEAFQTGSSTSDEVLHRTQDITVLRHSGRMFPSAAQLETSGRMFAMLIQQSNE